MLNSLCYNFFCLWYYIHVSNTIRKRYRHEKIRNSTKGIDKVNNALAELPNYTRVGSRVHSEGRYAFVDGIIGNAIQSMLNNQ